MLKYEQEEAWKGTLLWLGLYMLVSRQASIFRTRDSAPWSSLASHGAWGSRTDCRETCVLKPWEH
jgi:hypothetical protein